MSGELILVVDDQPNFVQHVPPDWLQRLVDCADNLFDVRVAVLDPQGSALADSRSASEAPLPVQILLDNRAGSLPLFRDARRKAWLNSIRTLPGGDRLVLAVPWPKLPIARILQSQFAVPFRRAGLLAFELAIIPAVVIARWVSAPLQRIALAAWLAASGENRTISPEGPSEVQDLARLAAGTADLEWNLLDLNSLLDGVVEKFTPLARDAQVDISKDWDNSPKGSVFVVKLSVARSKGSSLASKRG